MNVLGIETSCDETGVALYNAQTGLLADALHSQIDLHAVYGGVVPEIASRDHIRCLLPLIEQVLGEAGVERPDAIAYTANKAREEANLAIQTLQVIPSSKYTDALKTLADFSVSRTF